MHSRCSGLTLVESLIAITVIAILLALTIPSIQQVRNRSRQIQCGYRLHQVGIGLQNYHAALERFPTGCVQWRSSDPASKQLAWNAYLLPFVEQTAVFEAINFDLPFDHPANKTAASSRVPVFRCPSSNRTEATDESLGLSDFGGIYGERISGPNSPAKGVMLIDVAVKESDILDGLSNTIIVAEDTRSSDGHWINGRNIFDQAFAINSGPDFENDIRSEHTGGANVSMCDGSVDFLSNAMDLSVLAAICTRAGGEIVDP